MAKKETVERKPFNFGNSPLIKQTEEAVTNGYEAIERKEQGGGEPVQYVAVPQQPEPKRRKDEPTQNMLIHCPVSLHARLARLKYDTFEQTGERLTLNDMAVQAIAYWLDAQTNNA